MKVSPPIPQGARAETQLDNRHSVSEAWDPESGQAFGAVQDLVPKSFLPQLFRIFGYRGMGDGKSGFIVPRDLTVSASMDLPVQAGLRGTLASGL